MGFKFLLSAIFFSNIDWFIGIWVQIINYIHTQSIKLGFWNAKFHLWFPARKQKRGHNIIMIIIMIITDFSFSPLERDKEKSDHSGAGTVDDWTNESLDLLCTFYRIKNCVQHCHRHRLIGPLNETDVTISILHMRKLRMGEIRL